LAEGGEKEPRIGGAELCRVRVRVDYASWKAAHDPRHNIPKSFLRKGRKLDLLIRRARENNPHNSWLAHEAEPRG